MVGGKKLMSRQILSLMKHTHTHTQTHIHESEMQTDRQKGWEDLGDG